MGLRQAVVWCVAVALFATALSALGARSSAAAKRCALVGLLAGAYVGVLFACGAAQVAIVGPGHFPWLGKATVAALVIAVGASRRGPSLRELGVTTLGPRSVWPAAALGVAAAVAVVFVDGVSMPGDPRSVELLAFQATMPGLDEELFLRGLVFVLLEETFRRRVVVLGAPLGWSAVVLTVLFAWLHVFHVDAALVPHVETGLASLAGYLGFGAVVVWLRVRTGSVWWPVLAHNAANVALVVALRLSSGS